MTLTSSSESFSPRSSITFLSSRAEINLQLQFANKNTQKKKYRRNLHWLSNFQNMRYPSALPSNTANTSLIFSLAFNLYDFINSHEFWNSSLPQQNSVIFCFVFSSLFWAILIYKCAWMWIICIIIDHYDLFGIVTVSLPDYYSFGKYVHMMLENAFL